MMNSSNAFKKESYGLTKIISPLKPWEHSDTGVVEVKIAEALPGLDEKKTEEISPSDDSASSVEAALIKKEDEVEELPEEKKEPVVDDEVPELRRRYWVEKLQLVKDIRKRVLGEGDEHDVRA